MNARDLITLALEQVSPSVPRLPVVSAESYGYKRTARIAAGLSRGEKVDGFFDAIIVDEPTPTERAYATFANEPPRPTRYTVRIGDMQTDFTDLTAAKMFAAGVLMSMEQAKRI